MTPDADKTRFFDRYLPKWPAFVVSGKPVTKEQAAEILVRTDRWSLCGNDRDWGQKLAALMGLTPGDYGYTEDWEAHEKWKEDHGVLPLEYLANKRIYSSYIGGPHGWCDWTGDVFSRNYNIGKWPSVENVYTEWCIIAAVFPFLNLRSQLYSEEAGSDEPGVPVIEFVVAEGNVDMLAPHEALPVPHRNMEAELNTLRYRDRERGCRLETLRDALNLVKAKRGLPLL